MSKKETTTWDYAPAPESTKIVQLKEKYDLYINGKFVKPSSGKYFKTINPANEKVLASIAQANEKIQIAPLFIGRNILLLTIY